MKIYSSCINLKATTREGLTYYGHFIHTSHTSDEVVESEMLPASLIERILSLEHCLSRSFYIPRSACQA